MTPCSPPHRLGIVVVNYGSHELLRRNVASLDLIDAVVVVVDNFSTESERQIVARLAERWSWELLTPARNVGFGEGMNVGARYAIERGCDVLLLMNPDVTIAAETVAILAGRSASQRNAILTPRLDRADGSCWFAGGQIEMRTGMTTSQLDLQQIGMARWLTGACVAVHRTMWERLGGFEPGYFMYWEDIDLSQRCLAAGGILRVEHDLRAAHDVGGTQPGSGKSDLYSYYNCRNRLLFASRNLPLGVQLRWLLATPRHLVRVVRRNHPSHLVRRPGVVLRAISGSGVGIGMVMRSMAHHVLGARRRGPAARLTPASQVRPGTAVSATGADPGSS